MARRDTPEDVYGEVRLRRFFELLARGLFRVEACRAAQLDPGKVDRWLRAGDKGAEHCSGFARRVREVEAGLVDTELKVIRATDDYRARIWFLERRFPNQWAAGAGGDSEMPAGQVDDLRSKLLERLEAIIGKPDAAASDS